jgi:hypothetical protein
MELISFIEYSWIVLTSNVKIDQYCPQPRFFILMVRLYKDETRLRGLIRLSRQRSKTTYWLPNVIRCRSSMVPRICVLGVRSQKLSNIRSHWMGEQNILSRAHTSEGTLNPWSQLHLHYLAPSPFTRKFIMSGRWPVVKITCRIFITTWKETCCTDPT